MAKGRRAKKGARLKYSVDDYLRDYGTLPGRVPCNGCRLCCQKDLVRLLPGDDFTQYEIKPHPFYQGEVILRHKPNGDCIYLNDNGCSIQNTKPIICKEMDCRLIALRFTRFKIEHYSKKTNSFLNINVWHKGRELLKNEKDNSSK